MKKILFLLSISILLISCNKEEEPAFIAVKFIGDVHIDSYDDGAILQDFFDREYNTIVGDLVIKDVQNINFGLLSNVVEVTGDIILDNNTITTLSFLDNLKHAGQINILKTAGLDAIGLKSLQTVQGGFKINPVMVWGEEEVLNSFPQLESVGGELFPRYGSDIFQNNIYSFPRLTTVGSLRLRMNLTSTSIEGFPQLRTVEGELLIKEWQGLVSTSGLESLTEAGSMRIEWCPELQSLEGLESLNEVGLLSIFVNDNLNGLEGLENFTEAEVVEISYCDGITDLNGLNNLQNTDMLTIASCRNLTSLNGLEGLESISARLTISDNLKLKDFCALPVSALDSLDDSSVKILINGYDPSLEQLRAGQCSQ